MSFGNPYLDDDFLTGGVMARRCAGWLIDGAIIVLLFLVLWGALVLFGLLTLGLGFGALGILPFLPFFYNFVSLITASSATPGQRFVGLTVRRDSDLGPPTGFQALVFVLVFYLTIATSGLLLVVALFSRRHRTLHDLASGLTVVRVSAMRAMAEAGPGWAMRSGTSAP